MSPYLLERITNLHEALRAAGLHRTADRLIEWLLKENA